jgi:hypothetical protein
MIYSAKVVVPLQFCPKVEIRLGLDVVVSMMMNWWGRQCGQPPHDQLVPTSVGRYCEQPLYQQTSRISNSRQHRHSTTRHSPDKIDTDPSIESLPSIPRCNRFDSIDQTLFPLFQSRSGSPGSLLNLGYLVCSLPFLDLKSGSEHLVWVGDDGSYHFG